MRRVLQTEDANGPTILITRNGPTGGVSIVLSKLGASNPDSNEKAELSLTCAEAKQLAAWIDEEAR